MAFRALASRLRAEWEPLNPSSPEMYFASSGQRSSHRGRRRRHNFPPALPCPDYYEQYPDEVGPMGNVELSSVHELQSWLLVARPVSRAEAEEGGGCIKFTPLHVDPTVNNNNKKKKKKDSMSAQRPAVEPQYFCITDPDDVVYGRAQYISPTPVTEENTEVAVSTTAAKPQVTRYIVEDSMTSNEASVAATPCNTASGGAKTCDGRRAATTLGIQKRKKMARALPASATAH